MKLGISYNGQRICQKFHLAGGDLLVKDQVSPRLDFDAEPAGTNRVNAMGMCYPDTETNVRFWSPSLIGVWVVG